MRTDDLIRALQAISRRLDGVLESNASTVLDGAIRDIEDSKGKFDAGEASDWGYKISRESGSSLCFKVSKYKGQGLQADVMCDMRWQQEDDPPCRRNVELRVWSNNQNLMYRRDWDSDRIKVHIGDGSMQRRVMLRCHFDRAKPKLNEPMHHLQLGGISQDDEYCWLPEFSAPRLIHYPIDIVLLCQMIVANFFADQYENLYSDPAMLIGVKKMQTHLLKNYFAKCHKAVDEKLILLNELYKDDPAL